jgi:hypothetical protein
MYPLPLFKGEEDFLFFCDKILFTIHMSFRHATIVLECRNLSAQIFNKIPDLISHQMTRASGMTVFISLLFKKEGEVVLSFLRRQES